MLYYIKKTKPVCLIAQGHTGLRCKYTNSIEVCQIYDGLGSAPVASLFEIGGLISFERNHGFAGFVNVSVASAFLYFGQAV